MHNGPAHLQAPPRRVPLSLRIVNFFNGATQFGWIFIGVGLIAFTLFGLEADVSFLTFRNADGRTSGRVVDRVQTGSSENEQPVYASHYEYSVAGSTYTGTAYSTGMRRAVFGPWILPIAAIFPAIALTILFFPYALKLGVVTR